MVQVGVHVSVIPNGVCAGTYRSGASRLLRRRKRIIVEFMVGPLLDNPHRVGKPLLRELSGYLVARRGVYRIAYRIKEKQKRWRSCGSITDYASSDRVEVRVGVG
jgi:mRNA-degrading endonuclease RelE of RelBE toxin-antitoxin system